MPQELEVSTDPARCVTTRRAPQQSLVPCADLGINGVAAATFRLSRPLQNVSCGPSDRIMQ